MADLSLKKELRKILFARRNALTREEVDLKSKLIFDHWLKSFPPQNFKWIHIFIPIDEKNEVNTRLIRDEIDRYFPEIKTAVPVTDFANRMIRNVHVSPETKWIKNTFGITEPEMEAFSLEPSIFDLVLVPLLGFDLNGNRIGYGMGLYDRLLKEIRPDCLKIGIAFDCVRVDEGIPTEPHDMKLDGVITESGVLRFKSTSKNS